MIYQFFLGRVSLSHQRPLYELNPFCFEINDPFFSFDYEDCYFIFCSDNPYFEFSNKMPSYTFEQETV